jgi:Outer membrane protein beta-barrel domain
MNLHDDKHLDRLSREAAEQFEPAGDLHSWEKLHPRLEAALPQKKDRRRRGFFILFLFLLIGGGLTFSAIWMNRNGEDKDNAQLTKKTTQGTQTPKNSNANSQPQAGSSPVVTDKPINDKAADQTAGENDEQPADGIAQDTKTDEPKPSAVIDEKAGTNNVNRQPGISELFGNDNLTTSRRQRTPASSGNNRSRNNNSVDKNNTSQTNTAAITPADQSQKEKKDVSPADKNSPGKNEQSQPVTEPQSDKTVNAPQQNTTTPAKTDDVKAPEEKAQPQTTAQANTQAKPKKQASESKKRWEFGLTYGPDVSTIKFTHTQKPGTNVGLTIGYNISKRFSLQTGALYTMKNYKGYGKDYHPPKGYWTDYVDLKTVTADCNMWDIPLNLRYNLVPRKSSNVFVSAGLSSYLMKKEDYDYFYYYNGNPVTRNRSYETDTEHWLSILNISVGYERQISKNFSVQAEPFFKQPLKGVGFGNVKLNTTGVFLSVKYKPGR